MHCLYLANSAQYKEPFQSAVPPLSPLRNKVHHLPLFYPKEGQDRQVTIVVRKNSIVTINLETLIKAEPGYMLNFSTPPRSELVCLSPAMRCNGKYQSVVLDFWNVSQNHYVHDVLTPLVNAHISNNGTRVARTGDNFYLLSAKAPAEYRNRFTVIKDMRLIYANTACY